MMTRQQALAIYREHGLLLAQCAVREDVALRLCDLTRERDEARADLARVTAERDNWIDRLTTIIDEAFGLQPVQPPDELLTTLGRLLYEDRVRALKEVDGLRTDVAALRARCATALALEEAVLEMVAQHGMPEAGGEAGRAVIAAIAASRAARERAK